MAFFFYQFLFYIHIVAIECAYFERNSDDLVCKFEYGFVDSNDDAGVFFFSLIGYIAATKKKEEIHSQNTLACDETAKMQTYTRDLNTE